MMTKENYDVECFVDAIGMRCPMPLLMAKKALKQVKPHKIICVSANDPSAESDFRAMLKHLPHQLLLVELTEREGESSKRFYIRKGE